MIQNGIKPHRSVSDPFYKPSYKGSYFLSLLIGKDAMYVAVLDLKDNTYLAVEEFIFEGLQNYQQLLVEFENCRQSSALLSSAFEKVTIGIINEHATLVPEAFYTEEKKSDFFEFVQGKKEDLIIKEDHLVNLKARNIYAIPSVLNDHFQKTFPGASVRHYSTSLIDGLTLKYKQQEGEKVVLHVQYSHVEVMLFKNGSLNYFNSFNYTTAEDFIYYVLFSFEQLDLNADKIDVEVLGEIDSEAAVWTILYKYVRNVSFGHRPKVLNYSNVLDNIPSNYYYTLFQQFLCV